MLNTVDYSSNIHKCIKSKVYCYNSVLSTPWVYNLLEPVLINVSCLQNSLTLSLIRRILVQLATGTTLLLLHACFDERTNQKSFIVFLNTVDNRIKIYIIIHSTDYSNKSTEKYSINELPKTCMKFAIISP